MTFLGNLFGHKPPHVPAGCRARTVMTPGGWRVGAFDKDDREVKRLSPEFVHLVNADNWLKWVNGETKHFEYPAGEA